MVSKQLVKLIKGKIAATLIIPLESLEKVDIDEDVSIEFDIEEKRIIIKKLETYV